MAIIDEEQLADIRARSSGDCSYCESAYHTIDRLWRVVRAARRWTVAHPGRESVIKEAELQLELDELYAEMRSPGITPIPPEPPEAA